MIKAEIPFLSVAELSELIRKKEVSPVEATEAYLDRIDALDFKFNAYVNKHLKPHARQNRPSPGGITLGPCTAYRWR